jgi:hypothetical protein
MKRLSTLLFFIIFYSSVSAQLVENKTENSDTLVTFPGGDAALESFIKSNLHTTKEAVAANIQGDVTVKFMIDENGWPGDFIIIKRLGYGCDEEAIRTLRVMPRWQPGVINGRRIKSTLQKTLHFDLSLPVIANEHAVTSSMIPEAPLKFGKEPGDLEKYFRENFHYPSSESGKPGNLVLVVKFRINTQGIADDIQVVSGLSEAIDQEITRLIRNMPAWEPKRTNFRPVEEYKELVIGFKKKKLLLL